MNPDGLPRSLLGVLRWVWSRHLFPASQPVASALARPSTASLLLLLALPALLLYPTRGFPLLEPDEGRYAQIPREMLEQGEWVVPLLQGEAYLDKPPLMYWLTALSYRLLGVSVSSARLVPALCVHLTILAVYLLGRRSVGARAAFWAALLLTVAPGFVSVARLLLLDGLLTLCVTLSLLCGYEAVRSGGLKLGWWLAAAAASGLGFLTKGPIAEILLFIPLWVASYLSPGLARVRWPHYLLFFSVVLLVNLPWYAAIYAREPVFLRYFFWEHNVLRFAKPFDHLQPVWYYVPILAVGLLPATGLLAWYGWTLLVGSGEEGARRSAAGGFWLLAGLWCVLFFSCSGSKLPTYVLPAYPFLCLALGEFVAGELADRRAPGRPRPRALRTGLILAVAGMAAGLMLLHHLLLPWYARERSPLAPADKVLPYVSDRQTPVVCFPRPINSLAFHLGRSDMRSVHTRHVNQLYVDCHHRPRTVILFTHRDSFAGFRNALPPSLQITEHVSLRRSYSHPLLTRIFGETPWGFCDLAVVSPR